MKVETGKLAGQMGWYVFVDDMLDCDVAESRTEEAAKILAQAAYPGKRIVTTLDTDHYSNQGD